MRCMMGGHCMSDRGVDSHLDGSEAVVPLIRPCGPPSPRWGEEGDRGVGFAERVVAAARGWIGTPYRHQASLKGVGCDCLGLVRGVWRETYGSEPELPPAYQPDWAERGGEDRLREAARRYFGAELSAAQMRPGDLLLFCWRPDFPAKHAGILSTEDRFIHAYEQAAVIESALVPSWRRRIAGVFRFPGKV
jgi:NlpC/P60 family putative phage cell wall peptidase